MTRFTVDDNCVKCGLCAELCPARIIEFNRDDKPWVEDSRADNCIRCGQCLSFCPVSASGWDYQPPEERIEVKAELRPRAEEAETFLRSRRSIRRYQDKPVEDEMVLRILETARYAPSASNLQPVRWIITRGREKMRELGDLAADLFIRLDQGAGDGRAGHLAAVAQAWRKGHDPIFRGAPQLAVAVLDQNSHFPEDAAIALTYFELAAHANGVGCCWGGFFTLAARRSPELIRALGVKDNEQAAGAQMFGYSRGLPFGRILPPRKKINLTWL